MRVQPYWGNSFISSDWFYHDATGEPVALAAKQETGGYGCILLDGAKRIAEDVKDIQKAKQIIEKHFAGASQGEVTMSHINTVKRYL